MEKEGNMVENARFHNSGAFKPVSTTAFAYSSCQTVILLAGVKMITFAKSFSIRRLSQSILATENK